MWIILVPCLLFPLTHDHLSMSLVHSTKHSITQLTIPFANLMSIAQFSDFLNFHKKSISQLVYLILVPDWAWWLTPVIPALWEPKEGRSLEVRSLRPAWATWWNPISTRNAKISQAWWWVPVIPVTQEAEAEESLEPERRRLQWAKIIPLHSRLGNRVRLCPKRNIKS